MQGFIAAMTDYLSRRFPQYIAAIKALEEKDAAFYEACSNYEEICIWLATREQRSESEDHEELEQARELKLDLENEILTLLGGHSDIIS